MSCGVGFNSRLCLGHVVGGLDVHRGCCEAAVIDWFGNVVDSRRFSIDKLLSSFLVF